MFEMAPAASGRRMTMPRDYDDYQYDPCYECQAYGDDYYIDDDGELVCVCDGCPFDSHYDL